MTGQPSCGAVAQIPANFISGLPEGVLALQTFNAPTYLSQKENTPFGFFNLALHVGDTPATVFNHRQQLLSCLQPHGVHAIQWANQVHGTHILRIGEEDFSSVSDTLNTSFLPIEADAIISTQKGVAIAVLTADCLPVFLYDDEAKNIAVVHAGWRGLLEGIIEKTAQAMPFKPAHAVLGAAIGPSVFEVGKEIKAAFIAKNRDSAQYFQPKADHATKYLADIYGLATQRLANIGLNEVYCDQLCTVSNQMSRKDHSFKYYSYRRQPVTGRQAFVAALI